MRCTPASPRCISSAGDLLDPLSSPLSHPRCLSTTRPLEALALPARSPSPSVLSSRRPPALRPLLAVSSLPLNVNRPPAAAIVATNHSRKQSTHARTSRTRPRSQISSPAWLDPRRGCAAASAAIHRPPRRQLSSPGKPSQGPFTVSIFPIPFADISRPPRQTASPTTWLPHS